MPLLKRYEVYIFDCDGVIFDSNQLKIDAMRKALNKQFDNARLVTMCLDYFSHNFGKSRFHHIDHFLNSILTFPSGNKNLIEQKITS